MEIDIPQTTNVNEIEVIEFLITELIGYRHWVKIEDGKPSIWYEESMGAHSLDTKVQDMSDEDFRYYNALCMVKTRLEIKGTKISKS